MELNINMIQKKVYMTKIYTNFQLLKYFYNPLEQILLNQFGLQYQVMLSVIFLFLVQLAQCQFRTNGVTATQRMESIPYFTTQQCTLSAASLGIPSLSSVATSYSIQVSLPRQLDNAVNSNLIATAYQLGNSNQMGYVIASSLTNGNTTGLITLQVIGNTQIILLKTTLIILTTQIQATQSYITLFEKTVTTASLQYIKPYDLPNCRYEVYVKSVRSKVTGALTSGNEYFGFRTQVTKTADGQNLAIGVQLDNIQASYQVSVTNVIVVWNDNLIKGTAQFTFLNILVTSGESSASPIVVPIPSFNSSYMSTILMGQPSLPGLNALNPQFSFTLHSTNLLTLISNSLTTFTYSILQAMDYHCPTTAPYKFKSDQSCYSCPGTMIYVNTSLAFNEYRSTINAGECFKIDNMNSGYNFDRVTGWIVDVCGCCKQCLVTSYLEGCHCKLCGLKLTNCLECTGTGQSCSKCADGYQKKDADNNTTTINNVCVLIPSVPEPQQNPTPITPEQTTTTTTVNNNTITSPTGTTSPDSNPQPDPLPSPPPQQTQDAGTNNATGNQTVKPNPAISDQPSPPTGQQAITQQGVTDNSQKGSPIVGIVVGPTMGVILLLLISIAVKMKCFRGNQVGPKSIFDKPENFENFQSLSFLEELSQDAVDPDDTYIKSSCEADKPVGGQKNKPELNLTVDNNFFNMKFNFKI